MASLRTLHLRSLYADDSSTVAVKSESREACLICLTDIRVCSRKCPETDAKLPL